MTKPNATDVDQLERDSFYSTKNGEKSIQDAIKTISSNLVPNIEMKNDQILENGKFTTREIGTNIFGETSKYGRMSSFKDTHSILHGNMLTP